MGNSVLVVDDEQMLAGAMGDYLSRSGYSVSVEFSGEAALETIDREPPDIVVVDYRLPRMDGFEVLRRIKRSRPRTVVIVITAHAAEGRDAEAIELGAFDFLSKPLDLEELRAVVNRAVHSIDGLGER